MLAREESLRRGIILVERQEHADAPHAVALLPVCRQWPSRRAAEERDELAPSKANAHLALACEPVDQAGDRASTGELAPGGPTDLRP